MTNSYAMPVGDLPGWKQIYAEDFDIDVLAANGDTFLGKYPAFAAYDGFADTSGKGTYDSSNATLTVHDSMLDIYFHAGSGTTRYVACVLPNAYIGQTFGRWTVRMHSDNVHTLIPTVIATTLLSAAAVGASTVTVGSTTASSAPLAVGTNVLIGTDRRSIIAIDTGGSTPVLTLSSPLSAKAVAGSAVLLNSGYKGIPLLLWPKSNQWSEGEINLFENALVASGHVDMVLHEVASSGLGTATDSNNPGHPATVTGLNVTDDNVWDLQVTPNYVQASVNGQVMKYTTNKMVIPTTDQVLRMQFEVNPASPNAPIPDPTIAGHTYIDWIVGYTFNGA